MKPMYQQAPENTLASLVHGMEMFDAIEFDIRLTKDEQVVIHHDRSVSIDRSEFDKRSPYVEDWVLDELLELGFCSLEMLLDHTDIQKAVEQPSVQRSIAAELGHSDGDQQPAAVAHRREDRVLQLLHVLLLEVVDVV